MFLKKIKWLKTYDEELKKAIEALNQEAEIFSKKKDDIHNQIKKLKFKIKTIDIKN